VGHLAAQEFEKGLLREGVTQPVDDSLPADNPEHVEPAQRIQGHQPLRRGRRRTLRFSREPGRFLRRSFHNLFRVGPGPRLLSELVRFRPDLLPSGFTWALVKSPASSRSILPGTQPPSTTRTAPASTRPEDRAGIPAAAMPPASKGQRPALNPQCPAAHTPAPAGPEAETVREQQVWHASMCRKGRTWAFDSSVLC